MSKHGSTNSLSETRSRLTALVPIWDTGEQTLLLDEDRSFQAGQSSECDFVIAHPEVADFHAVLSPNADTVTVRPEGGSHVWVNDRLVQDVASVNIGDTLSIGPASFRVELRRAGRRVSAGQSASVQSIVSERLEKQLTDLQEDFQTVLGTEQPPMNPRQTGGASLRNYLPSFSALGRQNADMPPCPPAKNQTAGATPFLDFAATTNRQSALDERENQLNEWHRSLDRRCEELDKRSVNLTRQQATLAARQSELDHRTAELENWQQTILNHDENRQNTGMASVNEEVIKHQDDLKEEEQRLGTERQHVAEQLKKTEESRDSLTEQLSQLEEARQDLGRERSELTEERRIWELETQARQQADAEQTESLHEQQQKLNELAQQLEADRLALDSRESAENEQALQVQMDALERKEGELEILRSDIEAQRGQLSEEQVALEFERAESQSALEETRRLKQEIEEASIVEGSLAPDTEENEPPEEVLSVSDSAVQDQNAILTEQCQKLLDEVSNLEVRLEAAEKESGSLSALLVQSHNGSLEKPLTEQNLLAQLNNLKNDLVECQETPDVGCANSSPEFVQDQVAALEAQNQSILDSHSAEVARYEEKIQQLNEQLGMVQTQFEDLEQRAMQAAVASAASDKNSDHGQSVNSDDSRANDGDAGEAVATLKSMVEKLSQELEQRNATIEGLNARLQGDEPTDAAASMTPQEVLVLTGELDGRIVVLDEREEAVRERERLVEERELELQNQRVALQDARQQLELARAELHASREPASAESMLISKDLIDSVTDLAEAGAKDLELTGKEDPQEERAAGTSSVRSEIAELFGLGSGSKPEPAKEETLNAPEIPEAVQLPVPVEAPIAAEMMEAVDDYSQESAAAVSLSFKNVQDLLIRPEPVEAESIGLADDPVEEESNGPDDVVASYMEQLLSRSRAKASGEVPAELSKNRSVQSATTGSASQAEQDSSAENSTQAASDEDGTDPASLVASRPKIDREALRNERQSFRELSTMSTANALATHARQQERGNIAARTTILITLSLICVFVVAAAVVGAIPIGLLVAGSVVAVVLSATELVFKLKKVQAEVQNRTRLSGHSSQSTINLEQAGNPATPSEQNQTDTENLPPEASPDMPAMTHEQSEPVLVEAIVDEFSPQAAALEEPAALFGMASSQDTSEVIELSEDDVSLPETSSAVEAASDKAADVFDHAFQMLTSASSSLKKNDSQADRNDAEQ